MTLISRKFAQELNEKEMRDAYLSAQTRTFLAYQIRANRAKRGWSQEDFAEKLDTSQSAVSRMEDRQYGKLNLQSLFQIAGVFDCGLVVQFVPYEEFLQKTSDMSQETIQVSEFNEMSLLPFCDDFPSIEGATHSTVYFNFYDALTGLPQNTLSAIGFTGGAGYTPNTAVYTQPSPRRAPDLINQNEPSFDALKQIFLPNAEADSEEKVARLEAENAKLKAELEQAKRVAAQQFSYVPIANRAVSQFR